ncbi:RteC domain-containing protein [Pedobacter sp. UBA4863]|uniref:RteC domain-containing protein n=1 Tax=Pedobacter sp. UBA4863 TaxID=1947060 RepID=UPI0025DB4EB1|nr:RteC domain-containing protein [Pedobacter sp. UBA4863]
MLRTFSDNLYAELTDELKKTSVEFNDCLRVLTANLSVVRKYLEQLKLHILEKPFVDKEEEIWFFKYQNPRFFQWQIYYLELYTINCHKPIHNLKKLVRYLSSQIDYFDRLFLLNDFQHQYYRRSATEMDELYFLRAEPKPSLLAIPEVDPNVNTTTSYLFAKFMAYERLKTEIAQELNKIEHSSVASYPIPFDKKGKRTEGFRWTGEIVNLIEIAHGIYLNRQVNEGDMGINDFFECLGNFFGVNLGVPKRGFEDLRARKRLSKTHFIDRMREAILKKIDEDDAHNPHSYSS